MSSFRENASSSPRWCPTVTKIPAGRHSLRACKFGSLCIKFRCPFKHPSSRPRDCPDAEFCLEAKCPLHHPKARPIRQHKPQPRHGVLPKSRLCSVLAESDKAINPPTLSLSALRTNATPRRSYDGVSRMTRVRVTQRTTPTARFTNRVIVRSPIVLPSPKNRPRTGYFAATTKECVHGASCAKYGCTYKHPASRATDCPLGNDCTENNCALLHPLNMGGTAAIDAGFTSGQRVQAKFLPNSMKWSDATIHHICGSVVTLQFDGFGEVFKLPIRRVRSPPTFCDRFTPVCPCTPPPPRPPSSDLAQLERLKQAAVQREDFLTAQQVKQRIAAVKAIANLREQKQQAVVEENFLLAMDFKKQIADLESQSPSLTSTSTTDTYK